MLKSQPYRIFTIGHSNGSLDAFVSLLQKHQIEVVVDIRTYPYSKFAPQFNKHMLRTAVQAGGIKYGFMGAELGGKPKGAEFYDIEGYVLYNRLAASPLFLCGIERLETGIAQFRVAIMCSEEDPYRCHRRLLVGRVLLQRGVDVQHIRSDGTVQSEADLTQSDANEGQLALFEGQEEGMWKSLRPVSPPKLPHNSSES